MKKCKYVQIGFGIKERRPEINNIRQGYAREPFTGKLNLQFWK